MQVWLLPVVVLFVLATLVSSWIDRHNYYDYDYDYDNDYDEILVEYNVIMRRLSYSGVRLPIDADEIRGLQYLYNATNGEYWDWHDDTEKYGIKWNFTEGNLSLVHPCYDHWQGILYARVTRRIH